MHIPRAGERVYVDEHAAIFIVASVNHETHIVDLVPAMGRGPIKKDVPWQKLFRCWGLPIGKINTTPRIAAMSQHIFATGLSVHDET